MITDTIQDAQLRRAIKREVESMDIHVLQRIAYECRCEDLCIHPDGWKLYPED